MLHHRLDGPADAPAWQERAATVRAHGTRVVAGAAHLPNVEQPETVTKLILDHLGEVT